MERRVDAGPQVPPQGDRLVEVHATDRHPIGHPEIGEFGAVPADADPGDDPAATQRVERGELLGQHDRVALRHDDDARSEADAGVAGGDPGQAHDRFEDVAVVVGIGSGDQHVVGRPDGRPAEALGDVGAGVDALAAGTGTEVGQAQSVIHDRDGSGSSIRRTGLWISRAVFVPTSRSPSCCVPWPVDRLSTAVRPAVRWVTCVHRPGQDAGIIRWS